MKTFEIYWASGNKKRIATVEAWNESHAKDKVLSGFKGGEIPETRLSFNRINAIQLN